jgi:glycosyltransferase involved in cell wall biosynthesis
VQARGEYLNDVPEGIEVHALDAQSVTSALWPLARYIRAHRPRAILAALTHVNILAILAARLARFRGPVVVSERNNISSKARNAKGFRDRLSYRLVRYAYPLASKVVAVSKGVSDDLADFARLRKQLVTHVYNPVFDDGLIEMASRAPAHRWLGTSESPVFIAVGRLNPQKDFGTLINAFSLVRKQLSARLIIYGEGEERGRLSALARETGFGDDIDLPGFTDRPVTEMAAADVLVLSSKWEGFPNVIVEALAAGVPVVATNCPNGPDEILDGGVYGSLVPIGDAPAMATAMIETLSRPRDAEKLRRRASTFSVRAAASQYAAYLSPIG